MITLPDTVLDESADEGVRLVAIALLEDAMAEHRRLANPDDAEALHDYRVAVRRLRSWLRTHRRLLGRRATRQSARLLRRVARATSAGRDAEVYAEWLADPGDGVPEVVRSWCANLATSIRAIDVTSDDGEVTRGFQRAAELLSERLPVYQVTRRVGAPDIRGEPSFASVLAAAVRRNVLAVQRRLARVHDAGDDAAIHRARLAGKRLRYTLEPVAAHVAEGREVIRRLKQLQDTLGDAHDVHVWRTAFPAPVATDDDTRAVQQAVSDLLQQRLDARYETFVAEWSGEAWRTFADQVERVATALELRRVPDIEIERKFLLFTLPSSWPAAETEEIEQGYLPGERLVERLRHTQSEASGDHWYRTVKSGRGVTRFELEEETTRAVFETMWPLTEGRRVVKRRHAVPAGDLVWEVDEFTDRDLVLAEVELPSAVHPVEIPEWLQAVLVREVTGEAEYINANLSR